jgi:hypothetical protein
MGIAGSMQKLPRRRVHVSELPTSKERSLPTTSLEWIAHALNDAATALPVLFTMLTKIGARDGAMVADEILGHVKCAQKECARLVEAERRTPETTAEPHVIKQIEHALDDCRDQIAGGVASYIRGCISDYRHAVKALTEHICGSPTAMCDADCMGRAARTDDAELIERALSLLDSGRCEYEGCVQGAYPSARDGQPIPCMWHDERAVISRLLRERFPVKTSTGPTDGEPV